MAFITLDFETFYRSAKNKGSVGTRYSLTTMTYEEYIRDNEFAVHGVGIKIDAEPTKYYPADKVEQILRRIFTPDNAHTLLGHNTMFDGAILSWHYGLHAKTYYCTQNMSQALWAQSSASLDNLARRLWPNDETKRKGDELVSFNGIKNLSEPQQKVMGGYCINDVNLTFNAFAEMYAFFPIDELEIIDMTIRMFIHPTLILATKTVLDYQEKLILEKARLVEASGLSETTLSSNTQFAKYLETTHNIIVAIKDSPTKKNPDNTTLALAKDDVEFIELQAEHPELQHIWDARIAVKSAGELARCARLLSHAQVSHINPKGRLAIPLKYCGAHTKRFSGMNSVNVQNLGRGSPLRLALTAPEGHKILVRDLAAIEGRMSAWFNGQTDKTEMYRNKVDIYSAVATAIYGRPVDRKKLLKNDAGQYLNKHGEICEKGDAHCPDELEGFIGKTAELGLGYQMGANKFRNALQSKRVNVTLDFAKRVVTTWRAKNQAIVKGWARAEQVIFDMARKDLVPYNWGCITVEKERLRLPSGLYLTYPKLRAVETERGIGFEFWEGKFYKSLYGGLLMENIIQALSRVIMTDMMRAIENKITPLNARVVLTVHDEIVVVAPDDVTEHCMDIMEEEMSRCPDWCNDNNLVLTSEGGWAQNYSK